VHHYAIAGLDTHQQKHIQILGDVLVGARLAPDQIQPFNHHSWDVGCAGKTFVECQDSDPSAESESVGEVPIFSLRCRTPRWFNPDFCYQNRIRFFWIS
jgi:hypothetical protein